MSTKNTLVQPNGKEGYSLPFSKERIDKVLFADIDLIVKTKDGVNFVLPGAALAAMESSPPRVTFSDGVITADLLLSSTNIAKDSLLNTHTMESEDSSEKMTADHQEEKIEEQKKEIQEAKESLQEQDKKIKEQEEKIEEQKKKIEEGKQTEKELQEAKELIEDQEDVIAKKDAESLAKTEDAAAQAVDAVQKIAEELHSKDYDYSPPLEFKPPPSPFSGPAGVPAPISMTPLVLLTMGNVVGTEMSGATFYGGGGATGSDAAARLGPRDALQFSTASITGTTGNDIIYAEGPLVGNTNPAIDTSLYAKQFLLRVAGYFTELDDIVFQGLPSYVTVSGASLQADGSWVLPADYVISQESFELVYDKDAWRIDSSTFDMIVVVQGESRGVSFTSTELFRFQFMDVTDASQSTDPYLTFWDDGQNKQIYVLQTQDQPNTIVADAGDDIIYGGRNHDTIDAGDGDDQVFAYGGDNIIIGGDGDDQITTGDDNDTIDAGDGNNTIVAGAGINIIGAGDGDNSITTGAGNDTITVGDGNNTITAGDGDNTITIGLGNNTITTGAGADTITLGAGVNSVASGAGNDRLYGGTGDDTLSGEDGDDTFRGGLGNNALIGGTGNNTADYTGLGVAMTASLLAGAGTGVGVNDTYTQVQNLTGSSHDDSLTGDANNNVLSGGEGNDTLIGGGGMDILYGNAGDDAITGGSGNDTIYGGDGIDTINGGGAGADYLYGNDGDDIFINPTAWTAYDGGAGVDKIDYSAESSNLTIDLASGIGSSAAAYMSTYTSIEWIVVGSGADTLTGGSADEILDGGAGNDTLAGGSGSNTLIGGTGSNYYNMGIGADYIVANGTAYWDEVRYQGSSRGIVVNLDIVAHSFVNAIGTTVTVGALSGTSRQETSSDASSWSLGDTYNNGGVDYIHGTGYNDVIFGGTTRELLYGWNGNDDIFSGGGNDYLYLSPGNDHLDGESGSDMLYVTSGSNMVAYLDGILDANGNGTADYIDRGVTSVFASSGYSGFAIWSGTTLMNNIENMIGASGGDYLVGDNNANHINGQTGNNTLYGMGGDDIIFANTGNNTIDGGSGTDTISFSHVNTSLLGTDTGGWGYNSSASAEIYLVDTDLDGDGSLDCATTWGSYTGFEARTHLSGAYSYHTVNSIENIVGTINADKLAGDANANIIRGYNGDDLISGNGGVDSLYGDNGNDTFVVAASDMATLSLLSGGSGTDTIKSSGWTFSAGDMYASNAKFTNIESVDVRDSGAGDAYGLNAYDIQSMVDSGNSSVLTIRLDSGDIFTDQTGAGTGALSCLQTTDTATYDVFKYYSDAGHIIDNAVNLVGIVNVYYGA